LDPFGGVVASAEGGGSIKVCQDAEELLATRSCGVVTASGEKLNLFANIVASLEEVEKAANDGAELSNIDGGVISRGVEQVWCRGGGDDREVGGAEVGEHAT